MTIGPAPDTYSMGAGCSRSASVSLTDGRSRYNVPTEPVQMSRKDAESLMEDAEAGDFLLYEDLDTRRMWLVVRTEECARHYRIFERNGIYSINRQPFGYVDSIVIYFRKYPLNDVILRKQVEIPPTKRNRKSRELSMRIEEDHGTESANGNGNCIILNSPKPPRHENHKGGNLTENLV
ncbi:Hypp1806 [Branchiostoma lanceolatum]|uniref:Hypp1806 protein n=1 Tax=Branchiostoma lanceolatum TaxID=7740 RepID=A0A8K0EQE4_BRALA|nr:Hypp1806 [Branchiostoma lanceolatum]